MPGLLLISRLLPSGCSGSCYLRASGLNYSRDSALQLPCPQQAIRPQAQTPAVLVPSDTDVSLPGAQNPDRQPFEEGSSLYRPPSSKISPLQPLFGETTSQVLSDPVLTVSRGAGVFGRQLLSAWLPAPTPKRGCLSSSRKVGLPAHLWGSGLWSPSGTSLHAQIWSSLSTQPWIQT